MAGQHWRRNSLHYSPYLGVLSSDAILRGGLLFETELLVGPENKEHSGNTHCREWVGGSNGTASGEKEN
jgi:hypothetical protein